MRSTLFLIVTLFGIVSGCQTAPSAGGAAVSSMPATAPTVIRVSAVPDENPTELLRKFAPLVAHLERALGTRVEYTPVTDYGAVVQALVGGKVDFAWLGGFTFVQARRLAGAVPLCMRKIDRQFKTGFVAHRDSGIATLRDLRGKRFAFGSKSSTSGHLMPRHFLSSVFGIDVTKDFAGAPTYSGSHDATVMMVESGKVDAGEANLLVIERMFDQKQVDPELVKLVWTTPSYIDYVWAARKGVPKALRDKFKQAFLSLDANESTDRVVLALQNAKGFVAAKADDFDAVEKVGLSTGLLK
jgi:phosphonate transport system substrate-binding protein